MSISIDYLSDDEKMNLFSDIYSPLDNDDIEGVDEENIEFLSEFARNWNDENIMSISEAKYSGFKFPPGIRVYNPLFLEYIVKALSMICTSCRAPILKQHGLVPRDFRHAYKLFTAKNKSCTKDCGYTAVYRIENKEHKGVVYKKIMHGKEVISNKKAYYNLNLVNEEDLLYLGLPTNLHPKVFFSRVLVTIQKSFYATLLTDAEGEIIVGKGNKVIEGIDTLYSLSLAKSRNVDMYQNAYSMMMGSSDDKVDTITFTSMSSGKYSFISELKTTVVENTIRTTVIGAPNLPYNYLGVPRDLAAEVGVNIKVTSSNIDMIKTMKTLNLLLGEDVPIVEGIWIKRQAMNGDIAVGARSPILDPEAVIGYRIALIDGPCISYPLPMTSVANLDMDGDEMNLKVFEDSKATVEVMESMYIPNSIISGSTGTPVPKLVLNAPYGFVLLLVEKNTILKSHWHHLTRGLTYIESGAEFKSRYYSIMKKDAKISGHTLLSTILPPLFNYTDKGGSISIENGIITTFQPYQTNLESGIEKNVSGKKLINTVLEIIIANFPIETVNRFMSNIRILTNNYFDLFPPSIAISDYMDAYMSVRTNNAEFVNLKTTDSTLLETIGYNIKGDIDNIRLLLFKFPKMTSNVFPSQNTQLPFFERGSALETYNHGSNLFEGLSKLELTIISSRSRRDIIVSKKNVSKTGDMGNQVRATMAGVYLDNEMTTTFNAVKVGSVISPLFGIQKTLNTFKGCPVSPEFFVPSSTDSIGEGKQNLGQDIGEEDPTNNPEEV